MIECLKGMKDKIGEEAQKIDYLYELSANIFKKYGYSRIITPVLESVDLFRRTVGDETDIVGKEMYEFKDKGDRAIALRPEGTAGVVRAYIENGLYKSNPNFKCFYQESLYRYEAPQKGRYREFNQIGVENFGVKDPVVDAEVIFMACEVLKEIGIEDIIVEINNIGEIEERREYINSLTNYLKQYENQLSSDSKKRLLKNPLRILDSKDKNDIEILKNAPKLYDYLTNESKEYFENVIKYLKMFDIKIKINYNLVRGLDYYSSTVFEIESSKLGLALLGGGRYDRLLEILGNSKVPAIGFAMGVERLVLSLDESKFQKYLENNKKYYAIYTENTKEYMLKNILELRKKGYTIEYEYICKGFGNQMKKANKLGYKKVLIFGDEELQNGVIGYKNLETSEQKNITLQSLLGE